jgi:GMP synthase (glutamine-hydrolysing)
MIAVISCGSNKIGEFERIFTHSQVEYEVIPMEAMAGVNFAVYTGVIISGSPILVTDPGFETQLARFEFLRTFEKPILGVCFGHQVISLLYGATGQLGEYIKGDELIEIIASDVLFAGIDTKSYFGENHREYVSVPEEFVLLATSASCQNEAVRHKTKPIFGVQFHPEVSGAAGETLLKNFVALCE